jgi:chitodextrinase
MTILYLSNFDSETSGQIASGWTAKTGTWVVGANNPISGTQSFGSSTTVDGHTALYTGIAAQSYTKFRYSQKVPSPTSNAGHYSPHIRMDSGYLNGYLWILDFSINANKVTPKFFRRASGSFTSLYTAGASTATFAAGDVMEVECISSGSTHELRIWNSTTGGTRPSTPTATFTDATYASGYVGLYRSGAGSATTGIDDVSVDDGATSSDTVAPTMAVGSLSSSSITASGFTLSWTAASDNVAVTGYEYSTNNGTSWTDAGNVLTKAITGLAQNTLYHTQVRAYDAALNKSAPLSLDVTTATSSDGAAPTMNGSLAASAATTSGFTLTWSAASDNVAVAGYEYSTNGGTSWTDVGNVLTTAVSGLAANTAYTPQVRAYDAAGNRAAAISTTVSTLAAANNVLTNGTGSVLFSPYNWDIQASSAKTINAGAYFKAVFGGTSCTLNFDMTGIASPLPQISYRVDRFGPWISTPIAASVAITIPSDTADYANKGGHLLEVLVKSTTETQARWSTQSTAVKLTGIVLDAGKTISAPPSLPLKAIFYGDSITEGVRTVNMTATYDTDRNDAGQGWSLEVARILGAEIGNVGFGATGFSKSGSGGVPGLTSSYNYLYSGVARSFTPAPDFIVLMEGTNEPGDITAAATTVLNGLLAATPGTTKIVVLRPFDGVASGNGTVHATQLQNAIAACTAPSRVTYVNTAGWFTTANASDSLHPYGVENITHIAPLAANAIRSALASTGTTTARTVTLTLGDASGPLANLAGIKVAAFDQPTPDLRAAPQYKSAAQTTNASGVLTFTMQSTLAVGANCGVSVQLADGRNFDVTATVG